MQTLRYYERRGLLEEPRRSLGGHRFYPPETITALRIIKTAQRLGFTLDEVADPLDLGRRHAHEAAFKARAETSWPRSRTASATYRSSPKPCGSPSTPAATTSPPARRTPAARSRSPA